MRSMRHLCHCMGSMGHLCHCTGSMRHLCEPVPVHLCEPSERNDGKRKTRAGGRSSTSNRRAGKHIISDIHTCDAGHTISDIHTCNAGRARAADPQHQIDAREKCQGPQNHRAAVFGQVVPRLLSFGALACLCVCVCVCVCMCMYVCMYACVQAYMYVGM